MNSPTAHEWYAEASFFSAKGLYHAASERYQQIEAMLHDDLQLYGFSRDQLYFQQGRIALLQDADFPEAVRYFNQALEATNDVDLQVRYAIFLAHAYFKMGESDTSYRYLRGLAEMLPLATDATQGLYYANLAASQGIHGFYEPAIENVEKSYALLKDARETKHEIIWNNNKGLAYLELGDHKKAENHLLQALNLGGDQYLEPLTELSRLYLLQGRCHESVVYAERIINILWSFIVNYNKEEMARVCNLFAQLAMQMRDRLLALQLAEKSQVYYGQMGLWRQWQNMSSLMQRWQKGLVDLPHVDPWQAKVALADMQQFLHYLEVINAQEVIDPQIAKLLDVRVYYAKCFASRLGLSAQDEEDLVLASRLMDYGLTALEKEVIMDPGRSTMAMSQYKQHPSLGVLMLESVGVSPKILAIVRDHHEAMDGTGFPMGKKGSEIQYLSRVLAIVDTYAREVISDHHGHTAALTRIRDLSKTCLDADLALAFASMYAF